MCVTSVDDLLMKSRVRYLVGLIIVRMIVWRNAILRPSYDVTSYYAKLRRRPGGVHQFNTRQRRQEEERHICFACV